MRGIVSFFMLSLLFGVTAALPGCASTLDPVHDALKARYHESLIEINNPRTEGRIVSPSAVLTVQAEGVSAKKFRVVQANMKSPRFHVRDYAQLQITPDGRFTAAPGDFTLDKATRLVVLDVKVEKDRVRLFTHTLTPIRLAGGQAAYGCTEFVFHADPESLARGDIGALQGQIERLLSREASAGSIAAHWPRPVS